MFQCNDQKLWVKNPLNLFCISTLLPKSSMQLPEQINVLTRLVLWIFVFVLIFYTPTASFVFLALSFLFIFILYYIQRKKMATQKVTENFTQTYKTLCTMNDNDLVQFPYLEPKVLSKIVAYDGVTGIEDNGEWISPSQRLAGPANPKTKVQPIITPPIADLNYWKTNNTVSHSAINTASNADLYQSGYQVSVCTPPKQVNSVGMNDAVYENFEIPRQQHSRHEQKQYQGQQHTSKQQYRENYDDTGYPKHNYDNFGQVNMSSGYNPEQYQTSAIPTNLPAGKCMQASNMKSFNSNLFTQTLQSNILTTSEVIEPIGANIGISFQQQFLPTTKSVNDGFTEYTEHDPFMYDDSVQEPIQEDFTINEANVYDPRFTGYGTSYRSYVDDVTGQPRFYYDDVNTIRRPNYITRNNIDHNQFADKYGPLPENNAMGNPETYDIHELSQNAYITQTNMHRSDLQEKLMRKANARQWQLRAAPLRTSGSVMAGGMGM